MYFDERVQTSTRDSRLHMQKILPREARCMSLGHRGSSFLFMKKKTIPIEKKTKKSWRERCPSLSGPFSGWLIRHPVITILVIILLLIGIACFVWRGLQWLEMWARGNGYQWLALSGSLGNWFAFFASYCGVIATVVLGVLAVRLTIKQDVSKGYADITDLVLENFALYDLWRIYYPSAYGGDFGRRFILTFQIKGLKAYYKVSEVKVFWSSAAGDDREYTELNEVKTKLEETDELKVMLCFDDFDCSNVKGSFNYFFRLGCYDVKMMSLAEKRRWLNLRFEIHYADGSCIRYVNCEYCLEYGGSAGGHINLIPVDHEISISSRRKKNARNKNG